ncbi:telomere repeat-binding factor 1 [Cryptomeria japonica]|uniref:telomere repeat-binding factor 1 n=1 Tax=Cryptomeria japonica TaxID=3369 RepID=UPI0027D9FFCA|nr:telomere repeat-binding factor 1 [Cryptomeria japonica]XP_057824957.2 telomere repeat-binding factor 1 [Cryptomeria japonica]
MGAPKQKWTHEEEAALRAGVEKYGPGKWRAILKDPNWSLCLASRSNVDLKDKWRNMSVTANGWGSREKARLALKRSTHNAKHPGKQIALSSLSNGHVDAVLDVKPLTSFKPYIQSSHTKKSTSRLDNLILDAVSCLKDPNGSSKSAIAMYIEETHTAPPNFRRLLSSKLKSLTASGKLVKIRHNYMLNGSFPQSEEKSPKSEKKAKHITAINESLKKVVEKVKIEVESEFDVELAKIRTMNAEEAAKAAAIIVARAEAATAAAEQAALEVESAEAEAEAAEAFAEAVIMVLAKLRNS